MSLSVNTNNIINNLINALDIEINTIGNNPFRITAKNGMLVNSTGNIFIYKFELENTEDIPDDTNVDILINRQRLKATIISSRGLEMMIAFELDNGNHINQITIEISNANLLKSLKQLLENSRNGLIQINENIVLKLFGLDDPLIVKNQNIYFPPLDFKLDDYQIKTIENTIDSEIAFIWGPPGTGKTIVIAILTKMFVESGFSVLVTSNTNIAVDNVFEKYIKLFKDTSADLQNGKIIRLGNIQIESIKDYVQESAIIQRIAAPLYLKIKLLNDEMKPFKEKYSHLSELLKDFQEYTKIKNQLLQQQKQLLKTKSELSYFKQGLNENQNTVKMIQQDILQLEEMLKIAQNTNSFIRFLKGIKSPKTIEKGLAQKKYSLNNLSIKKEELSNSINSKQNEIKLIQENLYNSEQAISTLTQRVPNIERTQVTEIQNEIKLVSSRITEIEREITELKKQIEDVENNLLKEAKVIGATLSMFHSRSILYSRKYDVVIIDEVTMAIQPQVFFASCFAYKKVIVVGDFNQLQPIIRTKNNDLVKEWLKKDIFRKNGITSLTDNRLNTLKIQRRMKAPIAEISNQTLYNGFLEHQPISSEINDEPAVSFYNTSNFKPYSTIPQSGHGRINVYNGVLSIKLAQKYYHLENINHIGIITPYRSQANLISKLIKDLNLQSKVSADTVHKFQGIEKDVIIFDITDGVNTQGFRLGANLRDVQESPYLFNVAFTRAKHKLIVIGDLNYLRNNINDLPVKVRQMIGKITLPNNDNYEIVDSMKIIDDLIYHNIGDDILQNFQVDGLKHFTEEYFYEDFFSEINTCNKSLTIYSPFIANNRVTNNFSQTFFQNLTDRNIKMKIITKPVNEHPIANRSFANNCISLWKTMGITIIEKQGMHEKIAILDNKIIYHGSLNILSQWHSQETMLKILGQNSVNELLKVYS